MFLTSLHLWLFQPIRRRDGQRLEIGDEEKGAGVFPPPALPFRTPGLSLGETQLIDYRSFSLDGPDGRSRTVHAP
jgi:hypothetical protein